MEKLAIHGGLPVREKPFPSKLLGASLIGDEELAELKDVIAEKSPFRHYGYGNPHKVRDLEKTAGEMLGSKYTLAVSSGSAALYCACAALGLGPGDEVIIPAFGWFSNYYAVINVGALPVFADIDDSLALDPDDFERKITSRTRAVMVVHYQGGPARMDRISAIARSHGIAIIEDCCQAFGGSFQDKPLGRWGDIGLTSFNCVKMLTAGEGGLLWTDNEEYFIRAVRYHDLGRVRSIFEEQLVDKSLANEEEDFAGLQFRMSELEGAFLLAQMRKLPFILEKCRTSQQRIMTAFENNSYFGFRYIDKGDCGICVFMKFPNAKEALAFAKALSAEGVSVGPSSMCCNLLECYPIKSRKMVHSDLPPFGPGYLGEKSVYDESLCPNTNDILSRYVAIGIGPLYSDEDIDDIISAIKKVDYWLYKED